MVGPNVGFIDRVLINPALPESFFPCNLRKEGLIFPMFTGVMKDCLPRAKEYLNDVVLQIVQPEKYAINCIPS